MPRPEPQNLQQAFDRYMEATENLAKIAHLLDRSFTGRDPTASEMIDIAGRKKTRANALRRLVCWPCPDFRTLREKALLLNKVLLSGDTLPAHEWRVFLQSIFMMGKRTATDGD